MNKQLEEQWAFEHWSKEYKNACEKDLNDKRIEASNTLIEILNECIKNNIHLKIKLDNNNLLALKRLIIIDQEGVNMVFSDIKTDSLEGKAFVQEIRENPKLWEKLIEEVYSS